MSRVSGSNSFTIATPINLDVSNLGEGRKVFGFAAWGTPLLGGLVGTRDALGRLTAMRRDFSADGRWTKEELIAFNKAYKEERNNGNIAPISELPLLMVLGHRQMPIHRATKPG
jgi:hypothetical protein